MMYHAFSYQRKHRNDPEGQIDYRIPIEWSLM